MEWASMSLKPKKSRSIVLRPKKIDYKARLNVQEEFIPTVSKQPIKYLGKWYDSTIKDTKNTKKTKKKAEDWLR